MGTITLRLAAGVLVLLSAAVVPVLLIYEEGMRKLVVIPMLLMSCAFASYALKGECKRLNGSNTSNTYWAAVLLFSLILVLAGYFGNVYYGRWFGLGIVILFFTAFVVSLFIIHRRKKQLVRELLNTDKATQDRVLASLNLADRQELLKKLGR